MPGNSGQHGRQRGSRTQALILLVAGLWLLLLLTCIAEPLPISAASFRLSALAPLATTALTPTSTTGAATATPTAAGQKPTATAAATGTVAATGTATARGTATATATAADTGGGGGDGGGYQGSGPQPTRVVLAQPTAGAGGDNAIQGLSPAAFGSNGLLVATTLSCVISILGIVIAVIALSVLIRTGYGPFLRALLLGKRAGRQSTADVATADAVGGAHAGRWTSWDGDEDGYSDDRGFRGGGVQRRGEPAASRAPQRQAPISRSRAPQRQAPVSRSRSDWR